MGASTLLGSGTQGKSKLEAAWSPPGDKGSLAIAQSPAKQGSKEERRRRRGGKKRERKEKMKEGKRQENPNSHPGRDLKGQRQLSAPPSRTPKTSLLSSPHWHLSAAQTHTNAAEGPLQPRPALTQVLHPCKAQHHPTTAPSPANLASCTTRGRARSPHDPNVLSHVLVRHLG